MLTCLLALLYVLGLQIKSEFVFCRLCLGGRDLAGILGRLSSLFHPEWTHLAVMMTLFWQASRLCRPFRGALIEEVMILRPLGAYI